ncbi:hypothetical protein ACHHYP_10061 [Achlya hypogyna]|uniref:ZSWIM3 N-terminal domain-containing protein n=1 Tax=Achlya hypogyna TaxID=1202772 RepID=A0A1V9ZIK4_ACHHY|nr:hypothetical protein ACHHYP_10061 [Achlya hypogyna]
MATKRPGEDDKAPAQKWRKVVIGDVEIKLLEEKPVHEGAIQHLPLPSSDVNVYVQPPPCLVFYSFEEMTTSLATYFESTHQEFSTRNSVSIERINGTRKLKEKFPENDPRFVYSSITYFCKHGRAQKRRNNPALEETGKGRKVKFNYSGCQASLWVSLVQMLVRGRPQWVYYAHKMVNCHNHTLEPDALQDIASVKPFYRHLRAVIEAKEEGASTQDIAKLLEQKEPGKKVTAQVVRNLMRSTMYAKEKERSGRTVPSMGQVQAWNPLAQRKVPVVLSLPFHRLFYTMAKYSTELRLDPTRVFFLNLSSISSVLCRQWKNVATDTSTQVQTTLHSTILTVVDAAGTGLPPFCVLPRTETERPVMAPRSVSTVNGAMTPTALELWMMYFDSAIHWNVQRPVVLIVDNVARSHALTQICFRLGIILVAWRELYTEADHDVVLPVRTAVFRPFEVALAAHLSEVLPNLSASRVMTSDILDIATDVYKQSLAAVGTDVAVAAIKTTGLYPPSLPLLSAPQAAPSTNKSVLHVEEKRTASITIQSGVGAKR